MLRSGILLASVLLIAIAPMRGLAQSGSEHRIGAVFACEGGKRIGAVFDNGAQSKVTLTLSDGRHLVLPQALSASGARYANKDESVVFWNKGRTAFIEEGGQRTYTGCVQKK